MKFSLKEVFFISFENVKTRLQTMIYITKLEVLLIMDCISPFGIG
jgi:hypothetical protein